MDCREARRLLDQGTTPGARGADRAALGFHLAQCEACRAYYQQAQQRLLSGLLDVPEAAPSADLAGDDAPGAAQPMQPWSLTLRVPIATIFWYGGLIVIGLLAAVVVIVLGSRGILLFRIHQNVQAMIVTPVTATPALAPSLTPAPTQVALAPTATPQPSATATPVPSPTATPLPTLSPTPEPGGAITVLLLGSDRRPSEAEPSRTDAVIVARIDPEQGRVALLSLPRDLWVEIPGYGYARINAANVWGTQYGAPGGGPELARQTVSNLLGIPIDYYVYIDFSGFIDMIDAIGGITVDVEKELYDPRFPTMDYGYTEAYFAPGPQQMDGETALTYSRIRHPDNDFQRMRRQQAVLQGILGRLHEDGIGESIERIEALTDVMRAYVRTDLPEDRLIAMAWAMREVTPAAIERYTLEPGMVTVGVGSDAYALLPRPGAIEQLVHQLLGEAMAQ